jgi:predicted CXXCH cytochrome family protein
VHGASRQGIRPANEMKYHSRRSGFSPTERADSRHAAVFRLVDVRWWVWCLLMLLPCALYAAPAENVKIKNVWDEISLFEHVDEIPQLLRQGKINAEQIPDPHWREDGDGCRACHRGTPGEKDAKLLTRDINGLCNNCHDTVSVHNYIHAVGMEPSAEKRERMPESFRQAVKRGGGVVTCIACHDLPMQCKKERFAEKGLNPRFFRGGPYQARTDLCFNCHNPTHYERLNPHDQISDEGELNTQRCLVCHSVTPNRRDAKSIDDVSFNVTDDLTKLCTGCHPWRPHPGGAWARFAPGSNGEGPNHLVKPPEAILQRLKESVAKWDIVLPLDPSTGRIFCATCHNPHERGVQRHARADRGADGYKRLRETGRMPICTHCHNK